MEPHVHVHPVAPISLPDTLLLQRYSFSRVLYRPVSILHVTARSNSQVCMCACVKF